MWVGKNLRVWELPSSPGGLPNSGSPSSLLRGWRKLGRISQLETSEFRSWVPWNFYPCSWAGVARSREAAGVQKHELASAQAPGDSAGGPQPPCCLPGCCACHLAPFWGGLSENWSPEELRFVFTCFLGPGLPFGMEEPMLETGECESPVCPVMESEKLEIYLDATLSQPKPKYLYKTPRSEQTIVLWQKYSVWEFLTRSGSKHPQGVICARYRVKIIRVPGARGGKMREWNSKLKGLKQNLLIVWAQLTQVVFSYLCVETHLSTEETAAAGAASIPPCPRTLTEGGLCRHVFIFAAFSPPWAFSQARLRSWLAGFYGRRWPSPWAHGPGGPEKHEPAPRASLRGAAALWGGRGDAARADRTPAGLPARAENVPSRRGGPEGSFPPCPLRGLAAGRPRVPDAAEGTPRWSGAERGTAPSRPGSGGLCRERGGCRRRRGRGGGKRSSRRAGRLPALPRRREWACLGGKEGVEAGPGRPAGNLHERQTGNELEWAPLRAHRAGQEGEEGAAAAAAAGERRRTPGKVWCRGPEALRHRRGGRAERRGAGPGHRRPGPGLCAARGAAGPARSGAARRSAGGGGASAELSGGALPALPGEPACPPSCLSLLPSSSGSWAGRKGSRTGRRRNGARRRWRAWWRSWRRRGSWTSWRRRSPRRTSTPSASPSPGRGDARWWWWGAHKTRGTPLGYPGGVGAAAGPPPPGRARGCSEAPSVAAFSRGTRHAVAQPGRGLVLLSSPAALRCGVSPLLHTLSWLYRELKKINK